MEDYFARSPAQNLKKTPKKENDQRNQNVENHRDEDLRGSHQRDEENSQQNPNLLEPRFLGRRSSLLTPQYSLEEETNR